MSDPYEQARERLSRICLRSRISTGKDCREIIERALDAWLEAGKPEEEFYPWVELFFDRIGAKATCLVRRENYPVQLAIRIAAGYHPNST
jgi:hypothetical protein